MFARDLWFRGLFGTSILCRKGEINWDLSFQDSDVAMLLY